MTGCWFFVGLADDLPEDGDHLTLDLPKLSITLQNFRGEICGFWNVCSHRATQMRLAGRGNGHLRCPYHGWTYNSRGVPVGVPENEALFGFTREEKERLALRPVELAARGSFLFAKATPGGPALAEHLGEGTAALDARMLSAATRVAATEAVVELPWAAVLAGWGGTSPGELRVPPNLRLLEAGGWTYLEACTAVAPGRTLIRREVFHAGGGVLADLPDSLARLWAAG